jgi:hypothetical protein
VATEEGYERVVERERTTVEKIPEREDRRRGASPLGRLRINTALPRYRDVTHLLPVLVFQRNPVPGVTAQSEEGEQKGVEEGRGQEE